MLLGAMPFNCPMANFRCPVCGGKMKGHGRTAAGSKRWQCMSCGATATRRIDNSAKLLTLFLRWLLSKLPQGGLGMPDRTFRRLTSRFWSIWPIAPICDEVHHVVHVDGIWLGRSCVVLIACTAEHIVGWHLARSESKAAWAALMSRIAPPDAVVCDGGSGFEAARRERWPRTRVQRCTFHAFEQVKRCTTTRPRLQAGAELYGIAKGLLAVCTLDDAAGWLASFASWCSRWEGFLKEREVVDGRSRYKHRRLRKARHGLEKLCREGTLFTFLDEGLAAEGPIPPTNNRIEGGVNALLREMLKEHRGLRLTRRAKAIMWWCLARTENPPSSAEILKTMPTDETIDAIYRELNEGRENERICSMWGTAVEWRDLHW